MPGRVVECHNRWSGGPVYHDAEREFLEESLVCLGQHDRRRDIVLGTKFSLISTDEIDEQLLRGDYLCLPPRLAGRLRSCYLVQKQI